MIGDDILSKNLFVVENCYKIYRSRSTSVETVALRGVDLEVNRGEFITIVGPSGSGKTTLINLIGGLDEPSAGRIIFHMPDHSEGIILSTMDYQVRDQFRSRYIGFIFQTPSLFPQYTALEHVQLPISLIGEKNSGKKARELLTRLGLGNRLKSKPRQLSAGEKQRVAVASALIFDPILLLGDEPTGEFLQEINEENGTTMILVTHNLEVAKTGRRTLRLHDGMFKEHLQMANRDIIEEKIDEFGRIVLPEEIVEILHHPEAIFFDKTRKSNIFRLYNATLRIPTIEEPLSLVDKKNRINLRSISKDDSFLNKARLMIKSSMVVELELLKETNGGV
ncbi:MAG: ABC transporter ATP-binding protein [Candidatus Hodarchaeales archaeon]